MARKCSHCGYMGHNSRTCDNNMNRRIVKGTGGLKLFGVQMMSNDTVSYSSSSIAMIKKSFSMDCFSPPSTTPSSSSSSNSSPTKSKLPNGYLSDGLTGGPNQERKKGVPWTEEEHRVFLIGLEKLGKGDWRGISRNFVTTRTPTQVASHAQKYFLRQNSLLRNNRRTSLFDVVERTGKFMIQTGASMSSWGDISQMRRRYGSSIDFNFSTQGRTCKNSQPPKPVWLQGSFCSAPGLCTKSNVCTSAPDLELTLAAPRPLKQTSSTNNKSSGTDQLLVGPIRVV